MMHVYIFRRELFGLADDGPVIEAQSQQRKQV